MHLSPKQLEFLAERHLGTLTTIRADGSPHVVAIAFTFADGRVSVITNDRSQKVRNIEDTGRAAVCQIDGGRWMTLEGSAIILRDPDSVARAEEAFKARYRPPSDNPNRVAISIVVDRLLGSIE